MFTFVQSCRHVHIRPKLPSCSHTCQTAEMSTFIQSCCHEQSTYMPNCCHEHINPKLLSWPHLSKAAFLTTFIQSCCPDHIHPKLLSWAHSSKAAVLTTFIPKPWCTWYQDPPAAPPPSPRSWPPPPGPGTPSLCSGLGQAASGLSGISGAAEATVSLGKGFGSKGKQYHKHTALETQSHTQWFQQIQRITMKYFQRSVALLQNGLWKHCVGEAAADRSHWSHSEADLVLELPADIRQLRLRLGDLPEKRVEHCSSAGLHTSGVSFSWFWSFIFSMTFILFMSFICYMRLSALWASSALRLSSALLTLSAFWACLSCGLYLLCELHLR